MKAVCETSLLISRETRGDRLRHFPGLVEKKPHAHAWLKMGCPLEERMEQLTDRIIRAAKLDDSLYEEVEADTGAMGQAVLVVILSSVAAGIGRIAEGGLSGIITVTMISLLAWYIWAYLTFFIGTRWLPQEQTDATPGELLRTIGFSSAPGLIRVLGIVPVLTEPVFLLAAVWMLVAMVVAVRQALDYSNLWRAVGVCAVGWIIQGLVVAFLFTLMQG
jgi:hypothetical protein